MKETDKEKEERRSDHDVAAQDVVKVGEQNSSLILLFVYFKNEVIVNKC